jgi:hypothetical protein
MRFDVAVACRVLGVSRSGYYDWLEDDRDVDLAGAQQVEATSSPSGVTHLTFTRAGA